MKLFFNYIGIAASAIAILASCSKSDNGGSYPVADFSTSVNTIYMGGEVVVPVVLSEPAEKPASINLKFDGSAVKGTDYSVSSESVNIEAGSMVGSIVLRDINMSAGKEIKISIDGTSKAKKGNRSVITITCPGELLTYTFEGTAGNIIERYYVRIKLSGSKSGDAWRAAKEMEIPALLSGDAASMLFFSNDSGQTDSRGFVVKEGSNIGEVCLGVKSTSAVTSIKKAVLTPDYVSFNGVTPGTNPDFTLSVQGHYQLTGTWRFKEFTNLDAIKAALAANGDDVSLLPTNNTNFFLKISTESRSNDVEYTVIEPSTSGDFAAFFTKADITGCEPVNVREGGRIAGSSTAIENGISHLFMKLSNANRSFNRYNMMYGEAHISFRILDNGNMELTMRDYNKPPFGEKTWKEGSFDPDIFGLTAIFTYEK